MLRASYYNITDGRVWTTDSRGLLRPNDIQYLDNLPPSGQPNQMRPEWINRFTECVIHAVDRSRGACSIRAIGRSEAIEGEWVYELFDANGVRVTETAKNLAAQYLQSPGKWPAVDAYLDRVLGINQ
jgi:hypothetical protein